MNPEDIIAKKKREIVAKAISAPSSCKKYFKVAAAVVQQNSAIAKVIATDLIDDGGFFFDTDESRKKRVVVDHRLLPRGKRIVYLHGEVKTRIHRDFLSPVPIFDGKEFDTFFRISRSRFQRLMEDIAATHDPFYMRYTDAFGREGCSFEAKLLLPLKTMAYGVPPHCFRDYFSMSKTLAKKCCAHFDKKIKELYIEEYLRCPDATDLVNINKLHKDVHQFDGMFGSLDCMHTYWKTCPSAWQGSFKGKEKRPSIVISHNDLKVFKLL